MTGLSFGATALTRAALTASAALVIGSGQSVSAQAAYLVTLQEEGSNVVANGSGTIDPAGLIFVESGPL